MLDSAVGPGEWVPCLFGDFEVRFGIIRSFVAGQTSCLLYFLLGPNLTDSPFAFLLVGLAMDWTHPH